MSMTQALGSADLNSLDDRFTSMSPVRWVIWEGEAPAEPGASQARQEPRPCRASAVRLGRSLALPEWPNP